MIGCLIFFPLAGFFIVMVIYMGSSAAYFVATAGAMGLYFSGLMAYLQLS
jgi:hypothetical protein